MSDDFEAVLSEAIRRTGVERYRYLCSDANTMPAPNAPEDWRRLVREIATRPEEPGAPSYPPLAVQAADLGRSLWDWAVSGFSMASDEEQARRKAVCAACPNWNPTARRCVLCGCRTDAKIAMKTEHCPIDKW